MEGTRWPMLAVVVGIAIMICAVLIGNTIQPEVSRIGIDAYTAAQGVVGWALFFMFAFGFPIGLAVAAVGGASAGGTSRLRLAVLVVLAAGMALAPFLIPMIFGRETSPVYFSSGGYIILALVAVTMWLWACRRSRLAPEERRSNDFQGAGYACFGMAAWNICGIGGMPSFALYPERMIGFGTSAFSAGQMKAVMALLVLGWVFTAIGFRKSP